MSPLIATIVTGAQALKEFQLLLHTLEQWEPQAEVFVLTDTPTSRLITAVKSRMRLHMRIGLDAYSGLTRKDMEARSGMKYATAFHDYAMEKTTCMEWIFTVRPAEAKAGGVWFLDADICLLAPLPVLPTSACIALSPHYIRPVDESRYGHYNAGMIWMRDSTLLDVWRRAAYGSRFYEQAALEAVATAAAEELVELPIQDNFGWRRYLQSADAPPVIQSRIGYNRTLVGCGLTYEGKVLNSLHTHWDDSTEFNAWIRGKLEFVGKSHAPAKMLVKTLERLYGPTKKT